MTLPGQNRFGSETGDPLLLTPGPLTTSKAVKAAMLHDWGSRDPVFLALNRDILAWLPEIVAGGADYVAVPVQGSGTFAVEAMLTSLVPPGGRVLVLVNGAYGARARRILEIAHRASVVHQTPEDTPPDPPAVARLLAGDPAISHVFAVHCETTSGILNPLAEIASLAARHGRSLLVDAMSSFGALPLDAPALGCTAIAASANKCLEGVPGLAFVICEKRALVAAKGTATTLTLDLEDQWRALESTGQYRFTPPIHVIAALHRALEEFRAEDGVAGRGRRYAENCRVLTEGMRRLGFRPLLAGALQAPIIVTFHMPRDPQFIFQRFYDGLKARGFVIYPGKLTVAESFRIGCIGRIGPGDIRAALAAVEAVLAEMGVALPLPAAA
ncbi:MAG: 2-aminoethylphosphonate--pyruvate transaminase [Rhodospirillales bacterium]|nr:2-aminoethylphosphonate--pyruvate transaminase [Rhodospirillales bacterium]